MSDVCAFVGSSCMKLLVSFAKQDGNELPQVERHLNLVIFGATRLGELSCCHSWRSEWPRQQVTWQRRRHSPPFFSCGSLGKKMLCFTVVLGRCDCRIWRIYVLVCVGWKHCFARISCTDFLAAARHLSRVLPSNVSVVACPLLRAQGSPLPFPSVFATWPASLACHERSEVFEPDIRSTCLWDSELNCHHALSSVDLTWILRWWSRVSQQHFRCGDIVRKPTMNPSSNLQSESDESSGRIKAADCFQDIERDCMNFWTSKTAWQIQQWSQTAIAWNETLPYWVS